MNALHASTFNEIQKLFLRKKTIALLAVTAAVPVLSAIAASLLKGGLGTYSVGSAGFPVMVLGFFTSFLLPLFICMAAVDLFSGELGDRTLKIALLKPVTRFKVFVSKILAVAVYIVVSLAVVFLSSLVSGIFVSGGQEILKGLLKSILAYGVAIFPMILIGITAALIAQFFRSSSGALVVSILAYAASKIASVIAPKLSNVMITSYTDWHLLWIGNTVLTGKVFIVFMFILSYSIIFLTSGYYLFERREL